MTSTPFDTEGDEPARRHMMTPAGRLRLRDRVRTHVMRRRTRA